MSFFAICSTPPFSFTDEYDVKILKLKDGVEKLNSLDDLTDEIMNKKIVYIGEVHNNPRHHEIQLEIIKNLYEKNKRIAIGMEMFQNDFQYVVDMYISGKIDEKEFLKKTGYEKKWGFDYELYKPIIDFARENKIPVVALSINSEIVKQISENGLINLDSRELGGLPESIDFTNNSYKKHIKKVFDEHPKSEKSNFKRFYTIQVIWDESMAENIDRFLSKNKALTMIVLAGNGHIIYSYGIPDRAYRRNNFDYATILNDTEHKKGISDYVIYSKEKKFH